MLPFQIELGCWKETNENNWLPSIITDALHTNFARVIIVIIAKRALRIDVVGREKVGAFFAREQRIKVAQIVRPAGQTEFPIKIRLKEEDTV